MSGDLILALVARWLHILAAILALGGAFFLRFVLLPAAHATLSGDELARLRGRLLPRWKRVVHTCIALFLLSGFYTYLVVMRPVHEGQALYHALFGIKFLLALAVFYLGLGLTASGGLGAGLRKRTPFWLGWLVVLATVVVLISGYMRTAF